MKRINDTWWKDHDGYYKEVSKRVWEGPFESMDDSRFDDLSTLKIVAIDEVVHLKPTEEMMPIEKDDH